MRTSESHASMGMRLYWFLPIRLNQQFQSTNLDKLAINMLINQSKCN